MDDRVASIQREELLIHLTGRGPILGLNELPALSHQILDLIHVRRSFAFRSLSELGEE